MAQQTAQFKVGGQMKELPSFTMTGNKIKVQKAGDSRMIDSGALDYFKKHGFSEVKAQDQQAPDQKQTQAPEQQQMKPPAEQKPSPAPSFELRNFNQRRYFHHNKDSSKK